MKLITLLICLSLSINAFAFDFKGIDIGSTIKPEALFEKFNATCDETEEAISCSGNTTIVGRSATVFVKMSKEHEVNVISIKFPTESYEDVKKALIEKFNKPKDMDNSIVQNAMGAQFNQQNCHWFDSKSSMILDRYSRNITDGSLMLISKKYEKEFTNKKAKRSKDI